TLVCVNTHNSGQQVPLINNKGNISSKLDLLVKTMQVDFGVARPVIAVLGLNPHAGENGNIGREDEDFLKPAILEAKKSGDIIMGPYPADGFFGSMNHKKFDAVLAMYHDQGL